MVVDSIIHQKQFIQLPISQSVYNPTIFNATNLDPLIANGTAIRIIKISNSQDIFRYPFESMVIGLPIKIINTDTQSHQSHIVFTVGGVDTYEYLLGHQDCMTCMLITPTTIKTWYSI